MGISAAKKAILEEFQGVHDAYVRALCEFLDPEERKPRLTESMEKFKTTFEEAQKNEAVSVEEIRMHIDAIKEAQEQISYPKGSCSHDCITNLLRMQDLVLSSALAHNARHNGDPMDKKRALLVGLLEMSNGVVSEFISMTLVLASSPKPTWEVRNEVHAGNEAAQRFLQSIVKSIDADEVMAMKLPSADPTKYKEFLN